MPPPIPGLVAVKHLGSLTVCPVPSPPAVLGIIPHLSMLASLSAPAPSGGTYGTPGPNPVGCHGQGGCGWNGGQAWNLMVLGDTEVTLPQQGLCLRSSR